MYKYINNNNNLYQLNMIWVGFIEKENIGGFCNCVLLKPMKTELFISTKGGIEII